MGIFRAIRDLFTGGSVDDALGDFRAALVRVQNVSAKRKAKAVKREEAAAKAAAEATAHRQEAERADNVYVKIAELIGA